MIRPSFEVISLCLCFSFTTLYSSPPERECVDLEPLCNTDLILCESKYGRSDCEVELIDAQIANQAGVIVSGLSLTDKSKRNVAIKMSGDFTALAQAPLQLEGLGKPTEEYDANIIVELHDPKTMNSFECGPRKIRWIPKKIYGIDLGTTFSSIAVYDSSKKQSEVVFVDQIRQKQAVPTAVYFPKENSGGSLLFGFDAMIMNSTDSRNVIFDMKRFVGRRWQDSEVQSLQHNNYTFRMHPSLDGKNNVLIEISNWGRSMLPQEILALFMRWMVSQVDDIYANDENGDYKPDVLVSIPAYFHNGQRKAIRDAVKMAGLNLVRNVIEPSAAGISARRDSAVQDYRMLQVWDMGGGTFDVSVMECMNRAYCTVFSTAGDTSLGGRNFDELVVHLAIDEFAKSYGWTRDRWSDKDMKILRLNAEHIKISLSVNNNAMVQHTLEENGITNSITLSIDQLKQAAQSLLDRAWIAASKALDKVPPKVMLDAGKYGNPTDLIRTVLMVGGSSKFKFIHDFAQQKFTETRTKDENGNVRHPLEIATLKSPELAVSEGAGILASHQGNVKDVLPLSVGFRVCVEIKSEDKDPERDHYIEKSAGVWYDCDHMDVLFERNMPFREESSNTVKSKTMYYSRMNPTSPEVNLELFEAESKFASDGFHLGTVKIDQFDTSLPHKPDEIAVSGELDQNGIVTIKARYHGHSVEGSLSVVTEDGHLSKEQIELKTAELRQLYKDN